MWNSYIGAQPFLRTHLIKYPGVVLSFSRRTEYMEGRWYWLVCSTAVAQYNSIYLSSYLPAHLLFYIPYPANIVPYVTIQLTQHGRFTFTPCSLFSLLLSQCTIWGGALYRKQIFFPGFFLCSYCTKFLNDSSYKRKEESDRKLYSLFHVKKTPRYFHYMDSH